MKAGSIIGILGAAAAFAAFAPDLSEKRRTDAAAQLAEVPQEAEAPREQWSGSGSIALARAADGHFYADVTIDTVPTRMLVDTGATTVALTGRDAQAMGVVWTADEVLPIARGANGPVHGVPVVLERMRLGQFEARGVPAIVVPEGLEISLLGQAFLSRLDRVEIAQDEMVLSGS